MKRHNILENRRRNLAKPKRALIRCEAQAHEEAQEEEPSDYYKEQAENCDKEIKEAVRLIAEADDEHQRVLARLDAIGAVASQR